MSDIIDSPELCEEGLEFAKLRFANLHHELMTSTSFKSRSVEDFIYFDKNYKSSSLFSRKDLLFRVREYFERFYCPTNMTLYIMGDLSIDTMRMFIRQYFEQITRKNAYTVSQTQFYGIKSNHRTLRVDGHAILAKSFTKTNEKWFSVSFQLPMKMNTSSPQYVGYLFNSSQPGSAQYKLKLEGLINQICAEHRTISTEIQDLLIEISLTDKGSGSIRYILSYLFGYLEILKKMRPSFELYCQAREYYKSSHRLDSHFTTLSRCRCELLLGSQLNDLSEAEIPRIFDPAAIEKTLKCLTLQNCIIIVVSDKYANTPVKVDSEFNLQFSLESFAIKPRFDGLAKPQSDPLIVSSILPDISNGDLALICERPLAYQTSTAGHIYTMLNIGLKSQQFAGFTYAIKRLYAAMLNFKIWLETMKNICDVRISLADMGLNIEVKCIPFSLTPVTRLLLKTLSNPIENKFSNHLMFLKRRDTELIRSWLSGYRGVEDNSEYEKVFPCDISLENQLQQLEEVQSVDDLPEKIEGDLVLVFSGNATKPLSLEASSILSILQQS